MSRLMEILPVVIAPQWLNSRSKLSTKYKRTVLTLKELQMWNREGKRIGVWEIREGIERVASGGGHCPLYIPLLWLPWQTVPDMKLYRCWLSSVGMRLVLSGITACLGKWVSWCRVGKPRWTPNCQGCTVSHSETKILLVDRVRASADHSLD